MNDQSIPMPRSTPEAIGISSQAVIAFLDTIRENNLELHSVMLLRHGHVAAEGWWSPYVPEDRHLLYSLSKSFTSTAIGFAAAEQLLSLDDQVIGFFPDDLPGSVSDNLAEMRIRHLLMMGTGHAEDTTGRFMEQGDGNWARAFLAAPVEHTPGTYFVYNSGATYMLSAILHRVTGQHLLDFLDRRLLGPLGIRGATWETCPRGIAVGGWGMSVTTEDIAKFGQLYLQRGVWQGRQLLPGGWAEEASAKHIANGDDPDSDWQHGYGYQFWRNRVGGFRGDGAFGQFCIVLPDQDAVIAITSGTNDMQGVMNAAWEKLLPAMQPAALAPDEEGCAALLSRLQSLRIEAPVAGRSSAGEERLDGSTYRLEPNRDRLESVSFRFGEQEADVVIRNGFGEQMVHLGRGEWRTNRLRVSEDSEQHVEASFTWRDEHTLELTLRYVESPSTHTVTCRLDGEDIELQIVPLLSMWASPSAPIRGRMASLA